jgi:hypothetical protein
MQAEISDSWHEGVWHVTGARRHGGMGFCAQAVMTEFPDVRIAFGESDEYSFVLPRSAALYGAAGTSPVRCATQTRSTCRPRTLP